jgi:hypothetical protein
MNPPDAPIDKDLPCIRCGYNLRTLASNGNCPECGTPAWRTRLERPDVRAFRRFERVRLAYGLATAAGFCATWWGQSRIPHYSNTTDPDKIFFHALLSKLAIACFAMLLLGGAWLTASKYPRQSRSVWVMVAVNLLSAAFGMVASVA